MQIPENVANLCLQGIRDLIVARRALIHRAGVFACLAVVVMTIACTGGGGPSAPGATVLDGETPGPALTLVPPPTQTPLPTIAPTPTPTPMLSVTAGSVQEMTAVQIHERLSPSVAYIETSTGSGSGFLIEGGYVVTNHHVVWPWEEARVVFPDGLEFVARVAAWDPMSDIALLGPVEASALPVVLGNGENLPIGSEVFLLGYPGESDPSPTPTILSGLLSHYRQWDRLGMTYLQTDTSVAGGQSGGVLVNATGEVIGIVGFSFTEANYALAASAADLEPILQQLIQGRDPSGVSNRSFRSEQRGNQFDGNLQNTWDSRMYLMELVTGDPVEVEIDCSESAHFAESLRFNVNDLLGNTLLDVDNSFGRVGAGSAEVLMDGHHFLAVDTPAHSSSCFDLTANVPMVPYTDPDDGRRLNLDETIAGNIDYPGDRDWYSVHLEEGDLVRIYADSFNVDTVLNVDFPNSRVNQVVRDDDSGGGMFEMDSELVYRATVTGEHFVVVKDYDDWRMGGYFLSVDRAPPGTDAATVPPAREVDSPFGRMIVFESQLSDFSIQVPAKWVEVQPDEDDAGVTLWAVNSQAEEGEKGLVGVLEFDLQASDEEQTAEELADSLTDSFVDDIFEDGVETSREDMVTSSGDPGVVLAFREEIEPDLFGVFRMLVSIQDERYAFVVFYAFSQDESQPQTALTEYSFSTLDSSNMNSSGDGDYYLGRWLHVSVVITERLPELRYSTIDTDDVVRQWSLFPTDPGKELVLVRLKVENHTVDRISIDVDGNAAELRDMAGATYRPVSIAHTVWQDFRGASEALVRMDRGQCFDGRRVLIEPGTTVRWRSEGDTAQILAFEYPSVAVGPGGRVELAPGESVSHAFHEPGTYQYVCGNLIGAEWPAEVRVMPAGDRSGESLRSVLFLEGPFELMKGHGLDGYLVFEVPAGSRFQGLTWLAGDSITVPGKALPTLSDSAAIDAPGSDCAGQREALAALYKAAAGGEWLRDHNWLSNDPVDRWYGVTVDKDGCVSKLHLSENNLSGTIPVELGYLSTLKELSLSRNRLSGEIPEELGNLANLEELYLYENQLTGTIPVELGNLSKLKELSLSTNRLSGEIPGEVGDLTNLQELHLYKNRLTGTIPVELGDLSKLKELSLSTNQLTGIIPAELGNLAILEGLYLYNNQLTGTIPVELGNLAILEGLYLYNNQLTGTIPVELGNLSTLRELSLSRNQLTGAIPDELGNLTNLQELNLYENELSGEIPATLGDLSKLKELFLSDNGLGGAIPPGIGNLSNLAKLGLYANRLTGTIPVELGNLSKLKELSLSTNQFRGEIPAELGNLTNLEALYLHENQLSGQIPATLANLSNLKKLFLDDNGLSGAIPPEIGDLPNLEELGLYENQLSGTIPAVLGNLANLQELHLYENQLTGTIPEELGNLSMLRVLSLSRNLLTGEIPAALGNLTNLEELYVHKNRLTGTIPIELGNLSLLRELYLSRNQFTGEVPAALGNLTNLETLYLNENRLSGEIPATLGNLSNLEKLFLDDNDLGGAISPEIGGLSNLEELGLGDNQLIGEIPLELSTLYNLKVLRLQNNELYGTVPIELRNLPHLENLSLHGNLLTESMP